MSHQFLLVLWPCEGVQCEIDKLTNLASPAFALPTTAEAMNYNSVITVGVVVLTAAWWLIHARKNYPGPKVMTMYIHEGQSVEEPLAAGGLNTEKQEKKDEKY